MKRSGGIDEWGSEQSGACVGGSAACDVVALVRRGWGLWACGVCVCRLSCGCEATPVAGVAVEPDGVWELALFGAVGVCGQSGADQPRAAGAGRVDCRGTDCRAARARWTGGL